MMKGADAAILAVCESFKLKTQARPVYIDPVYRGHEIDEDDEEGYGKRPKLNAGDLFEKVPKSALKRDGADGDLIGDEFRSAVEKDYMGDEEESLRERLEGESWVNEYKGVNWLNKMNYAEASVAYVTVYIYFPWYYFYLLNFGIVWE